MIVDHTGEAARKPKFTTPLSPATTTPSVLADL